VEITNAFVVRAPIDVAWATLTDLPRIAPCLPGATLTGVEGDVYKGHVTVKVGPIVAKFGGQATFLERDDAARRAVLKGEGRDSGGKGNASATITAQMEAVDAATTRCSVRTDLTITGRMAQFGRGALADVSEKLLAQFVANLESTVLAGAATADASPSSGAAPQAAVPINLLGSSGLSLALVVLRRFAPVALVIVALVAFLLMR
jgi:carbon monoxide dehydrogenase subunit G